MKRLTRLDRGACACLVARGADRKDFLNRMATNDLIALEPGRAAPTFFLERTGRVVDRVVVLEDGEQTMLLGSAGRSAALTPWLEKHIIADEVAIADVTATTSQWLVLGDGAMDAIRASLGFATAALGRWDHFEAEGALAGVRVARVEDVGGPTFRVVAARAHDPPLEELLGHLPELGEDEWRARRVEAGVPEFGAEFTERTIPLETRQIDHFSFTKGCYVGQEVVARLHNYKRVKRALVRLRIAGGDVPPPKSPLFDGEREVGAVTSAAMAEGAVFALGYVEAGLEQPGRRLALRHRDSAHDAEVLTLTLQGDPK